MKIKNQNGFSLIELMIVVALIGILTAIAVPQYQVYMIRSKITEGMQLATSAKLAVNEYYLTNGELPNSSEQAGVSIDLHGHYVDAIVVGEQGVITALYSPMVGAGESATLVYTPKIENGSLDWMCQANMENRYKPTSCR